MMCLSLPDHAVILYRVMNTSARIHAEGGNLYVFEYTMRRLFYLVLILFGVSILVFLMVHIAPGDPILVLLGEDHDPADYQRLMELYGFDRPLPQQYFSWLGRALQGDLGVSIRQGINISSLIWERMGATVELAVVSVIIAVSTAIPLGVLAALKRGTVIDMLSMVVSLLAVSMPPFWLALVLLTFVALNTPLPLFGRGIGVLPGLWQSITTGSLAPFWDGIRYVLLPALSLGLSMAAVLTRLTRSSMLDILNRDYVRTARAKGLSGRIVVYKHALRNALLPVVTIVGVQFGALLGGAVVTETVFAWPGVGRLIVNAISQRDFPIVQGGVLMLALIFSLVNLAVDLSYGFLNPRIRYE